MSSEKNEGCGAHALFRRLPTLPEMLALPTACRFNPTGEGTFGVLLVFLVAPVFALRRDRGFRAVDCVLPVVADLVLVFGFDAVWTCCFLLPVKSNPASTACGSSIAAMLLICS